MRKWVIILEITDKAATEEFALTEFRIQELISDNLAPELPGRAGMQIRSIKDVTSGS